MKSNYIILGLLLGFVFIVFACDKDDTPEPEEEGVDCSPFTWYKDNDQDGFGDPDNTVSSCEQPVGFILNGTDCDDNNAAVNPNQEEIINDGIDNNCDGESVDAIPSAVEMTVESVGFNSALITWTESTSEPESEIYYRVLLDGVEVASEITRTHYLATDLDEASSYSFSVIAYNDFFESEVVATSVTTATYGSGSLKLAHVVIDFTDIAFREINYSYNDLGQLINEHVINAPLVTIDNIRYAYDSSNRIKQIDAYRYTDDYDDTSYIKYFCRFGYSTVTGLPRFFYFGEQDINYPFDDYSYAVSHSVEGVTESTFLIAEYIHTSPPWNTFTGTMFRDPAGHLSSVSAYYEYEDEFWEQSFQYSGENLVKITNDVTGDVYEITYDSNINYHQTIPNTYHHLRIGASTFYNQLGYLLFPFSFSAELKYSTLSFLHENSNNPTSYIKNGSVIRTIEYEYYPYGLPKKIIADGDPSKAIYFYYTAL